MTKKQLNQFSIIALSVAAAFSVTTANAGQIQASSVNIAREAIVLDTQTVAGPSISYRFAGDVDARSQDQTFQIQFTLAAGTWATTPGATAFSVTDGITGGIANQDAAGDYTVVATGRSADNRTIFATITVRTGVGQAGSLFTLASTRLIRQPIVSVNVSTNTVAGIAAVNTSAARGTISGLRTVVGDIVGDFAASPATAPICQGVRTLAVSVRHFVGLSAPAALASGTTATEDESVRAGNTNTGTLFTFPTNILPRITASAGNTTVTAGTNLTFTGSAVAQTLPVVDSFVSATVVNLGAIDLRQNSTGTDADLVNSYLLAGAVSGTGIAGLATANEIAGRVEAARLDVVLAASNGFVVGGNVFLSSTANCAAIVTAGQAAIAITTANAAGPITLSVPTGAINGAFGVTGTNPVYACYSVVGVTNPIPLSAFSVTSATLVKSAAVASTTAPLNEQNNVCSGNQYSLGGGIRIDVRNYANSRDPSGFFSVIRLINNDEARAVDVFGQLIHPNGTFGPSGLLTQGQNAGTANANRLAPRAVLNLTSAQVDALLTTAPAAGVNNGPATAQAAVTGSRLRITSNSASTLRVQNYLFNPSNGTFFEASGGAAVDFSGTAGRVPANEGQLQFQDAQTGLNGAR